MAITTTVDGQTVFGNKRIHYGTTTLDGGDTTGTLITGLQQVHSIMLTATGSTIVADAPTVNATLPLASGSVPLIFTANKAAYWVAIGL